jgi:hypothetical protein
VGDVAGVNGTSPFSCIKSDFYSPYPVVYMPAIRVMDGPERVSLAGSLVAAGLESQADMVGAILNTPSEGGRLLQN